LPLPGGGVVRFGGWGILARSADNRGSLGRGSASRLRVMPALYFRGQPPSKIPQGGPILPGRYGAGAFRIAPTRRGAGEIGVIAWGSFKRATTRRCVVAPVYFVFARIHADMDSMNR
jgi:hypothetical protein